MMRPVILVVLDGLRYATARACLGYAEALVEGGAAQVYRLRSALPSLSRPLYETLMTGLVPLDHGVTGNTVVRLSRHPNVFSLARRAGLVTAAAAYHWFCELYNHAPFEPRFRRIENADGGIAHGAFYWRDDYPDDHLFADAQDLLLRHAPHFMLVHPMNIDDAGHRHGGGSAAYRNAARHADDLLSRHVPDWLARGYAVLVTSDHGMGDDASHGGTDVTETEVPLYTIGADTFTLDPAATIRQTDIAGLIAALLAIPGHGLAAPAGVLRYGEGALLPAPKS
ncbi:MAG: alkaline phosphatase family protein [Pseudochelatococcus sp.]|jgi:predicted AlkP superfamily pyrophosphatase or phosphodiesterase|uniref:alkaline phosphatase family protein n=1 Tax=Pseudochelatococcus sp. TaxID=2020869 RepID=UPI003D8FA247